MINWRTILGLVFLLAGVKQLFTVLSNPATVKASMPPIYAEAGCVIWMGVGVYLIIKGTTMKKDEL